MLSIDLNCDLGEARPGTARWVDSLVPGAGVDPVDDALLTVVTSANVACGGHAGNLAVMAATAALAAERGVALGAHPSYSDTRNFGRMEWTLTREQVADLVYEQVAALDAFGSVRYLKPHGALYNRIVWDEEQAAGVVDASLRIAGSRDEEPLPILGLPGSAVLERARSEGVRAVAEAFADRGYRADGTLVPRSEPGALITDADEVAERVVAIATGQPIAAVDGSPVLISAESVCVHGDTPGAVELASRVREALNDAGVTVAPFVPVPGSGRR